MKPIAIESWTLRIIDDVAAGRPNEDARVELKMVWPATPATPAEAARQIAGHANAAGGAQILWIIGVHQKRGVEGAPHQELATWYPQVQSYFDGLAPRLTDVNIPIGDKTVVALVSETDRAPFVTRNPVFRQPGGGPVEREVPWREGTSVRSARREELLRLLSPLHTLPELEILSAKVRAHPHSRREEELEWSIVLQIYVVPVDEARIALPFHYCQALLSIGTNELRCQKISLKPITQTSVAMSGIHSNSFSHTVIRSDTEVIIDGPGTVVLRAEAVTPKIEALPETLLLTAKIRAARSLGTASLSTRLSRQFEKETAERESTPRLAGLWLFTAQGIQSERL